MDRTAVCCLSSVNAETFLEWREEPRFIEDIMRFLDNVLEDFIRRQIEVETEHVQAIREAVREGSPLKVIARPEP